MELIFTSYYQLEALCKAIMFTISLERCLDETQGMALFIKAFPFAQPQFPSFYPRDDGGK